MNERKFTEEQIEEIRQRYNNGESVKGIAASLRTCAKKISALIPNKRSPRQATLLRHARNPYIPEFSAEEVNRLYSEGHSIKAIAKMLSTCSRKISELIHEKRARTKEQVVLDAAKQFEYVDEIASAAGVSKNTAAKYLGEHGIKRKDRKGIEITCWGETFTSLKDLANDHRCKVEYHVLQQRILSGEPPEQAVLMRKRKSGNAKPVTYKGEQFESISQLAAHLNTDMGRLAWRIKEGRDESTWADGKKLEGITYKGEHFKSVRALAEHLGVGKERLSNRIKSGWPEDRWADIEGFEGRQAGPLGAVEYDGVTYPSYKALAETYGINYKLVHLRIKQGLPKEEWVKPVRDLSIQYKGQVFPSLSKLAKHLGITAATLKNRMDNGWEEDDWGKKTNLTKPRSGGLMYKGKHFSSIGRLAAHLGIGRAVLQRRIANNVPESEWHLPARQPVVVTIDGITYNSLKELADAAGIDAGAMQARLSRGWTGADLLQPLGPTSGTKAQKRKTNHAAIKKLLQGLREHVDALSPRDIYILFQQHDLNNLPKEQGGLLVQRLTGGLLPPELIKGWLDGEDPTPPEPPAPAPTVKKPEGGTEPTPPTPGPIPGTEPRKPEPPTGTTPPEPPTGDPEPVDLPKVESVEALKLLNSHAWATDDVEAAESLICSCLDKVWNHAYEDEDTAVEQVTTFTGNAWTDELRNRFLTVYNRAKALQLPAHYIFPHKPRLMQLVAAAEAAERRRLLILSGMGLGKTLASLLATQAARCGLTWVVCPNNAIDQWEAAIHEQWEGVEVRKKVINPQWQTFGPCVLLLNFERFSHLTDQQIAELMGDSAPDAFIIDEVQFAKQRTDDYQSKRREQLAKCIQLAGERNDQLMVLGMSGTPILNNLMEGKKLIELVFAEERQDLGTDTNMHNAMRMFQEFTRLGIRQRGQDIWPSEVITHPVDAQGLLDELRQVRIQRGGMSAYEQVLVKAKLPTIRQLCSKRPTVIITEFTTGIVEPIRQALMADGLRVGVFTGDNKLATYGPYADSLEEFKAGATDVLIGSGDCIGTGIDGLQYRCHQMIFATLPWTYGDYEQIVARLARNGQEHEVQIHIPQTSLNYLTKDGIWADWSFCDWRWSVIAAKRALAAAAVDGISPGTDDRLTPQKAVKYIEGWLDRLGNDTVIQRYGRPIRVPLVFTTEGEEITARRRYGDFSSCNSRWNNANSTNTHARLTANPQEWELYHTDLAATRKQWMVDPLQEVIKYCRTTKGMTIGDFGCGTAELADAVRGRHTVHSFDHIAINDGVTACDIGQGVPLADESLDLAVFCLSLMGTNWRDYLVEAYRCLKPTGQLIVWMPANQSATKMLPTALQRAGFKVIEESERYKWQHAWAVRVPNAVELGQAV